MTELEIFEKPDHFIQEFSEIIETTMNDISTHYSVQRIRRNHENNYLFRQLVI